MGFTMGPARGMQPQAFMMGTSAPVIDPRHYRTKEEYEAALKRRELENDAFYAQGSGLLPPIYWLGDSGYEPEKWKAKDRGKGPGRRV